MLKKLCAMTLCISFAAMSEEATGFINFTVKFEGEDRWQSVYVPHDYDAEKEWPLIVFLHGAGERGDDGLIQTEVGIGTAIRRYADRFPCIVVMPQCPKDMIWAARTGDDRRDASAIIDASMEFVLEKYSIDKSRITLTGLSMGGFGTWNYGARHIDTFAAFVPICGGGNLDDIPALARRPIWAFHGDEDRAVKPEQSRRMVAALEEAGADVTYTEYEGVGHDSWVNAYADPETAAWLLSKRLPEGDN